MIDRLQRVCIKLRASRSGSIADAAFVPIFHEWIRDRSLPLVLIDVADYTHVPDGPGVMLIGYSTTFALDRSGGELVLLAQGRRPTGGNAADAIAETWYAALNVAGQLERDSRLRGKLTFDRDSVRVESNDRLHAPNTGSAFDALEPFARAAARIVWPELEVQVARVANDPRDRLAMDVRAEASAR